MDTLEIEFQKRLRSRDFGRARIALEKWSRKSAIGEARSSFWKACLLYEEGSFTDAFSELTEIIDTSRDVNCLCLIRRARMFLDRNELKKALADYRTILSDQSERVVEAFHSSARMRVAYILARLGDAEFEMAIRDVQPNYSEWVFDKIWNVSDLEALYVKTSSTHRVRG